MNLDQLMSFKINPPLNSFPYHTVQNDKPKIHTLIYV